MPSGALAILSVPKVVVHPMPMPSGALAVLFDCQAAASDRDTVKCTLAVVGCESPLIRRHSR